MYLYSLQFGETYLININAPCILRVHLGITMYTICHFNFGICAMYSCKACIHVHVVFFPDHFRRDVEFVTLIHQIRHNVSATGASDNGNGMN